MEIFCIVVANEVKIFCGFQLKFFDFFLLFFFYFVRNSEKLWKMRTWEKSFILSEIWRKVWDFFEKFRYIFLRNSD